jgi:hypothetical protein
MRGRADLTSLPFADFINITLTPTQVVVSSDGDFYYLLPSDSVLLTSVRLLSNSSLAVAVSFADVDGRVAEAFEERAAAPEWGKGMRALQVAKAKCGDYGLPTGDGVGWRGATSIALTAESTGELKEKLTEAVLRGREKDAGESIGSMLHRRYLSADRN